VWLVPENQKLHLFEKAFAFIFSISIKSFFMELNQPDSSLFQLNLDPANSSTLRSAASWAKVMSIIGFIFGILFVLLGFLIKNALSNRYNSEYESLGNARTSSLAGSIGLTVYVILGLICIISSIFAINFGNKISRALNTNDQNSLGAGFAAVRNYFAFWSILMILGLLLMIIGGVAGVMNAR
jgi:hypothetical protein